MASKATQVTPQEEGTRREWKLPQVAIDPSAPTAAPPQPKPTIPPQHRPSCNDFRWGEKVAFEDRYLQAQVGKILRINQRTATIDTGDGTSWRVGFGLLGHILDV